MIENDLFATMFDIIPFGIYVVDINTFEIIYMNKHMIEHRGNFIGKLCYENIYCEDKVCYFCKIKQLIDSNKVPNMNSIVFEIFNPADDKWYQLQERAMNWPDGRVVKYSICVDITELKETQNKLAEAHAQLAIKNKELQALSSTDKLTKLNNRFKIDEIFKHYLNNSTLLGNDLSIIMVDLDEFKNVNDMYGHQAGDMLLKEISQLLSTNLRKTDHIGRWGGEEFLIICPNTNLQGARAAAENLRTVIESYSFEVIGKKTASFGIACLNKGEDEKSLFKKADDALYKAKKYGGNRVESL